MISRRSSVRAGARLSASASDTSSRRGRLSSRIPPRNARVGCASKRIAASSDATTTSGLVAYLDGEPVGWCAVEPRPAYEGLLRVYRVPWEGRSEDKTDASVWAVTCVFARAGFRRRGIGYALARAAVDFARERGARVLEAYPMLTQPGDDITWGELHMGTRSIFAAAGFEEVLRPTPRRVVMRIDFYTDNPSPTTSNRNSTRSATIG